MSGQRDFCRQHLLHSDRKDAVVLIPPLADPIAAVPHESIT
jgi:hypothetical protein